MWVIMLFSVKNQWNNAEALLVWQLNTLTTIAQMGARCFGPFSGLFGPIPLSGRNDLMFYIISALYYVSNENKILLARRCKYWVVD